MARNFRGRLWAPKNRDFGMPILHDQLRSCSITSLDSHFLQSRIAVCSRGVNKLQMGLYSLNRLCEINESMHIII